MKDTSSLVEIDLMVLEKSKMFTDTQMDRLQVINLSAQMS